MDDKDEMRELTDQVFSFLGRVVFYVGIIGGFMALVFQGGADFGRYSCVKADMCGGYTKESAR